MSGFGVREELPPSGAALTHLLRKGFGHGKHSLAHAIRDHEDDAAWFVRAGSDGLTIGLGEGGDGSGGATGEATFKEITASWVHGGDDTLFFKF